MIPESKVLTFRIWNRIEDFFNRSQNKKCFVVELWDNRIISGWVDISDQDTFNFSDCTYDYENSYIWYQRNTVFVKHGIRKPISFNQYLDMFLIDSNNKHQKLAIDGKTAHAKMNNKNISDFIKANKDADINFYLNVVAAVASVVAVLYLSDMIHSPNIENIQNILNQVQNNTEMIKIRLR